MGKAEEACSDEDHDEEAQDEGSLGGQEAENEMFETVPSHFKSSSLMDEPWLFRRDTYIPKPPFARRNPLSYRESSAFSSFHRPDRRQVLSERYGGNPRHHSFEM
jgi:hypothetical protein